MLALATCCLMTLAMGTLHAWSVFTADLEQTLSLTRTQSSLVYSLTLVTLTLTVLIAAPLFARLKPWVLFALAAVMAGIGLLIASGGSFFALLAGYSFLFGIANGIGYGYALQLSARVFSHRSGFAMGVTTALYALGATLGAQFLGTLAAVNGSLTTLRMHGISFLILAPILAGFIIITRARYDVESSAIESKNAQNNGDTAQYKSDQTVGVSGVNAATADNDNAATHSQASPPPKTPADLNKSLINQYRMSYGLAVFAGLMAMAHATPFINSLTTTGSELDLTETASFALMGAIVLGLGNAAGGLLAGIACDTVEPKTILSSLPAIAGIALGIAAVATAASVALTALVIIGFTYGALIAVYPVAIARHFGPQLSATAYGRVFIAWGIAGLLAPVVAGTLYDWTQSYRYPMLLAMGLSFLSTMAVIRNTEK